MSSLFAFERRDIVTNNIPVTVSADCLRLQENAKKSIYRVNQANNTLDSAKAMLASSEQALQKLRDQDIIDRTAPRDPTSHQRLTDDLKARLDTAYEENKRLKAELRWLQKSYTSPK